MTYLIVDDDDSIVAKFRRIEDRDICLEALELAFPNYSFYAEDE